MAYFRLRLQGSVRKIASTSEKMEASSRCCLARCRSRRSKCEVVRTKNDGDEVPETFHFFVPFFPLSDFSSDASKSPAGWILPARYSLLLLLMLALTLGSCSSR